MQSYLPSTTAFPLVLCETSPLSSKEETESRVRQRQAAAAAECGYRLPRSIAAVALQKLARSLAIVCSRCPVSCYAKLGSPLTEMLEQSTIVGICRARFWNDFRVRQHLSLAGSRNNSLQSMSIMASDRRLP